jgi:hypothetical protein
MLLESPLVQRRDWHTEILGHILRSPQRPYAVSSLGENCSAEALYPIRIVVTLLRVVRYMSY